MIGKRIFQVKDPFRKSFFTKILGILVGLTLIPLFFIGFTSYFVVFKSMQDQSDDYDLLLLNTLVDRIDRELSSVRDILFR